jgi:hypothetical protein
MAIVLNGDTGISSVGALSGVTSVSSVSANTPVVLQDSSSKYNTCRAWVTFNGTGTVAIRASFNVSSITDNGTGNYTVNFTTAMPDTNYSIVGTVEDSNFSTLVTSVGGTLTTNAVQVLTGLELTKYEYERVYVVVFR